MSLALLWGELRPFWRPLLAGGLCSAAVAGLEGARLLLIREVVDTWLLGEGGALLPLALGGATLLHGAFQALRTWLARRPGQHVAAALRRRLFSHYQRLPFAQLEALREGDVASRLTQAPEGVQVGITALITAVQQPLTLVVLVASAAYHQPQLTLVGLAGVPLLLLPLAHLRGRLRRSAREGQAALAQLHERALETVVGARTLRTLGAHAAEEARMDQAQRKVLEAQGRSLKATALVPPLVSAAAAVGMTAVLLLGAQQVRAGAATPGSLMAFLIALILLYEPVRALAQLPLLVEQASAGLERVSSLLALPAEQGPTGEGRVLPEGPLALRGVGLSHQFPRAPGLASVDVDVAPGGWLALTGPSGAGKSTLLALLAGLLRPTAGEVLIGGEVASQVSPEALRRRVLLVPQEVFLLDASLAENLRLGRGEATDLELWQVLEVVELDALVRRWPQGLDSRVGPRGALLSGGQAQRLALARALLRRPSVLLLDEATGEVDAELEGRILARLRGWPMTVVLATHRPAAALRCDRRLDLGAAGELQTREAA